MKRLCPVSLLVGALALSACTGLGTARQKNAAADPPATAQAENAPSAAAVTETAAAEIPPPSPEQQAAAVEQLQSSELANGRLLPRGEAAIGLPPGDMPPSPPESALDLVPGGKKLRMGAFATPEESLSSEEASAPSPNSVELKGFRSPKMPAKLPMDINGKITDETSE